MRLNLRFSILPSKNRGPEQGFALVFLCLFLPMAILILVWSASRSFILVAQRESLEICRDKLTQTQSQVGEKIQTLLTMNPIMKALHARKIATEIALAGAVAAQAYPLIKILKQQLQALEVQRRNLIFQQQTIIKTSKALMVTAQISLKSLLQKIWDTPLQRIQILNAGGKNPTLGVKRKKSSDEFPEYELKENFIDRQCINLRWHLNSKMKPEGANSWMPSQFNKKMDCGVSLKRKIKGFEPILHQAKFY